MFLFFSYRESLMIASIHIRERKQLISLIYLDARSSINLLRKVLHFEENKVAIGCSHISRNLTLKLQLKYNKIDGKRKLGLDKINNLIIQYVVKTND